MAVFNVVSRETNYGMEIRFQSANIEQFSTVRVVNAGEDYYLEGRVLYYVGGFLNSLYFANASVAYHDGIIALVTQDVDMDKDLLKKTPAVNESVVFASKILRAVLDETHKILL